jgi:prepilin-type N-terminal cleavage/methylation domain-containing protein/prepilin-type processing-associated H-X9-DG protein
LSAYGLIAIIARMRGPCSYRTASSAFTLIELLVVVAIIAVLSAMLLPAIGTVRGMALNSKCTNNLRMLTVAMLAYGSENDSTLPYRDTSHWETRINEYLDETYQGQASAGNNAFRCPLAAMEVQNIDPNWGRFGLHFSINENLYATWNSGGWWDWGKRPVSLSRTRAGQVLLADGCFIRNGPGQPRYIYQAQPDNWNTWAGTPWPVGANLACFDDPVPADTSIRPIVRHRGRVTQSFVDGHVAPVTGSWNGAEQTAAYRR